MCKTTWKSHECGHIYKDKFERCPARTPQSWWACCLPSPPPCNPRDRIVSSPSRCVPCDEAVGIPLRGMTGSRSSQSSSQQPQHRHRHRRREKPRSSTGEQTRDQARRAMEDDGGPATRTRSGHPLSGGYTAPEYHRAARPQGGAVGLGIYHAQGPAAVTQQYWAEPAMGHGMSSRSGSYVTRPVAAHVSSQPRPVSPLTESEAAFPTMPVLPYDEYPQHNIFY
ncbi:hypothetical protein AK830_g2690 [Neonectria ditissima]|uniref:Uncharacterized protein n=1 Tax=Neonectria ditissima TaxID=78410 RepID=A0A0P7BRI1_9HYPO|nr:hypothetical protein AK830_g2690 [Neonectria ditissima]